MNKTIIIQKNPLKKRKFNFESLELHLMISPAVIYAIVFLYLPMFGLIVAFKNFNYADGIFGSPWAGLENFRFFFESGKWWDLTVNTILYNLAFMGVNLVIEVALAIFLSELSSKIFTKTTQSLMILPYFISWVVGSIFVYAILNYDYGVLNNVLRKIGLEPIQVYAMPGVWKYIIVALNAWHGTGYGCIVYLAAIMGMDRECFEAASIDGATIWQRIRHINLPLLMPTIIIKTLLNIGHLLRGNFELFYQIIGNNGMLQESTDIIDTFVFRSLLSSTDIGMSSAVGFYQSILCFVMIIAVNWLVKKYDSDYALF